METLGSAAFVTLVAVLMVGLLALTWIVRAVRGKDVAFTVSGWGLKISLTTKQPDLDDGS